MRARNLATVGLMILTGSSMIVGCDDTSTNGPGEDTAQLSLYLTDAPGDVEEVWVEIQGVSLQGGGDGPVDLLGSPTELIPITDLVGVAQLLAADVELEEGTYNQLRMRVGDAALLSAEGTVYLKGDPVLPEHLRGLPTGELQCPSCSQSGLKITVPNGEIDLEGGSTSLVLDFDVAESFGHKAGKSGKWVMHPVIHGILTDTPASAGAILGTVALASGVTIPECPTGDARAITDFVPTATSLALVDGDGNPIVRNGSVAADGTFQIRFLVPGGYTLGYRSQVAMGEDFVLTFTATVDPTQVTVAHAEVAGVAYTVQTAACQPVG